MRKILFMLMALAAAVGFSVFALRPSGQGSKPLDLLRQQHQEVRGPAVDHARFEQLAGPFSRPQEVTAACIDCHNSRHAEVMASSHWNWERLEYIEGKGIRSIGKRNILNNFCIGVAGSQQTCDSCHVGYGWSDATFDLDDPLNVDCLACHDNSGDYSKKTAGAGMPAAGIDLAKVARAVGRPQRANCGACHFLGGGGNNVKHGDLEVALLETDRQVDVHMAADGGDMSCVECHRAENHKMLGKSYSLSSMNRDRVECESCHGALPHEDEILNQHGYKVACQTCHIPTYAKVAATKLAWDWSTAGSLRDGKPYQESDAAGNPTYMSTKGSFVWGRDLRPEYAWFDGTASHYLLGDEIDPAKPTVLNPLFGDYDDPDAKIVPLKVHRARQIYDVESRILVQPKLYSAAPGDSGYWKEFDWNRAAEAGMREVGLPYSGKYGFAATEMNWPINHMVAPKEQALSCEECHRREGGRLAALGGFYLPGRDRSRWLDGLGAVMVMSTLAAVVLHGGARLWFRRRRQGAN
jgi:octaheme c-type cytochrome (tetrathionate reductase family)